MRVLWSMRVFTPAHGLSSPCVCAACMVSIPCCSPLMCGVAHRSCAVLCMHHAPPPPRPCRPYSPSDCCMLHASRFPLCAPASAFMTLSFCCCAAALPTVLPRPCAVWVVSDSWCVPRDSFPSAWCISVEVRDLARVVLCSAMLWQLLGCVACTFLCKDVDGLGGCQGDLPLLGHHELAQRGCRLSDVYVFPRVARLPALRPDPTLEDRSSSCCFPNLAAASPDGF
jgi:hypothetical protein